MLHHTISLMLGGALHVAALPKKLERILDCGTGTGIWAIDMAKYGSLRWRGTAELISGAVLIQMQR